MNNAVGARRDETRNVRRVLAWLPAAASRLPMRRRGEDRDQVALDVKAIGETRDSLSACFGDRRELGQG